MRYCGVTNRRSKPPLAEFRKAAGLSQKDLGEAIGVDQATVCYYETGQGTPRLKQAFKVAARLGQPLEVLWANLATAAVSKRGKVVGKIGPTPRPTHRRRGAAVSGAEVRSETAEIGQNHETA